MTKRRRIVQILSYIFLTISTFIMVYPILVILLGAFTTNDRFRDSYLLPIPNTLNIELFQSAWNSGVWQAYVFTLSRCLFYLTLALGTGLIGGYILSKMQFPGKDKVFLLFLSGMLMPGILMILPQYVMMAWV